MLDKMRASPLYREDQSSFILYPDRQVSFPPAPSPQDLSFGPQLCPKRV